MGIAVAVVAITLIAVGVFTEGFGLLSSTKEVYVLSSFIRKDTNGSITQFSIQRNEQGEPSQTIATSSSVGSKLVSSYSYKYQYDSNGNMTSINVTGSRSYSYIVECDEKGCIVSTNLNTDNVSDFNFRFQYEETTGLLSTIDSSDNSLKGRATFSNGLCQEKVYTINDSSTTSFTTSYSFDDNNRPITYTIASQDTAHTYTISYDDEGNISEMTRGEETYSFTWQKVSRAKARAKACPQTCLLSPDIDTLIKYGLI